MYLAEMPSDEVLEEYYAAYAPLVRQKFKEMLGTRFIEVPVRNSSGQFHVRLGEFSNARRFISRYSDERNLRRLLIGDFYTLLGILEELKDIDKGCKIPISKTKHGIRKKCDVYEVNDDLNAIFHRLFVKEIYERPDVFDKHRLAEMKSLSVCPYCGASPVVPYRNDAGNILGYQIEHYMPKSIYPFLAISFFNLFPACSDCNDIRAKGVKSPLAGDDRTQCLMHPNCFDAAAMHFSLDIHGSRYFAPDNYGVYIDYHGNLNLQRGYRSVIPIENRYKAQSMELAMICNGLMNRNNEYREFVKSYGVRREDFIKVSNTLNFEETPENSRTIEKYKFKVDIFHKLLNLIP